MHNPPPQPATPTTDTGRHPIMDRYPLRILGLLLVLGFIVRSLGPLGEPALGQTDAYAHLQFLNDILASGRLRHPFYPPGFYWLLAVPAGLLGIDPYWIARYAGAFFGCALILALYLPARRAFGRHAALWTAFLVAACPAFHWLHKTGVGAYPSQLGLALVPLILWSWDGMLRGHRRRGIGLMALLVVLALSTPIMLIDLLPLLALDLMVRLRLREIDRTLIIGILTALGLLAVGVATTLLLGGGPPLADIASAVSGVPRGTSPAWQTFARIAVAYVTPERWAPQGRLIQLGAIGVGGMLAVVFLMARRMNTTARMLALWALLSWAQSVFGLFQFSHYMRAGWMLLAGLAVLGGWLIVRITSRLPVLPRRILLGVLLASSLISLAYPPLPQPHLSPAESDLVRTARDLAAWSDGQSPPTAWLEPLGNADAVTVWSRAYNAYPGHQGDPLHALLERSERIRLRSVEAPAAATLEFAPHSLHLVLLDDQAAQAPVSALMRVVNPALSADFEQARSRLITAATALRRRVDSVEAQGWNVQRMRTAGGLEAVWISGGDRD